MFEKEKLLLRAKKILKKYTVTSPEKKDALLTVLIQNGFEDIALLIEDGLKLL